MTLLCQHCAPKEGYVYFHCANRFEFRAQGLHDAVNFHTPCVSMSQEESTSKSAYTIRITASIQGSLAGAMASRKTIRED